APPRSRQGRRAAQTDSPPPRSGPSLRAQSRRSTWAQSFSWLVSFVETVSCAVTRSSGEPDARTRIQARRRPVLAVLADCKGVCRFMTEPRRVAEWAGRRNEGEAGAPAPARLNPAR